MVQTVGCQPCFQGKSSPPSYGARLDFFRIFDRAMRFFLLPHGRFRDIVKNMKQNSSLTKDTLDSLLSPSVTVMPEGFAINLELDPKSWSDAVRSYSGRAVCDATAAWLSAAYREAYQSAFLFSERCMSHELRYHLYAYLWTQGLKHLRPITTFLFPKARLIRSCRSVEIDVNDVYKWNQRIIFRYFAGITEEYRRTDRDPYAVLQG